MTSAGLKGPLIIARSLHGLEWVCAAEVSALTGASGLSLGRREVAFRVGEAGPSLLGLRTADDVFLVAGSAGGIGAAKTDLESLGRAAAELDWRGVLDQVRGVRALPESGNFDVVASLDGKRGYNRFAAERWLGRALAPELGFLFAERVSNEPQVVKTDLTVRTFIHGDSALITVRLGARPLHRRDYKTSAGAGTLHPPAAAALAAIAAPPRGTLLDPFCGDGTIAIEAAIARPGLRVLASDLDQARVVSAAANARLAGVGISVSRADAGSLRCEVDAVVTNPPWDLAIGWGGRLRESPGAFWRKLPDLLGANGAICTLTDAGLEMPDLLVADGWAIAVRQRLRLAGRVADLLFAAPPGAKTPKLPAGLRDWRARAIAAGVISDTGF